MSKSMRRWTYRGKKQEYIRKDVIANILAKMARWGVTISMLQNSIDKIKK